jgi:hypothetical protein
MRTGKTLMGFDRAVWRRKIRVPVRLRRAEAETKTDVAVAPKATRGV